MHSLLASTNTADIPVIKKQEMQLLFKQQVVYKVVQLCWVSIDQPILGEDKYPPMYYAYVFRPECQHLWLGLFK